MTDFKNPLFVSPKRTFSILDVGPQQPECDLLCSLNADGDPIAGGVAYSGILKNSVIREIVDTFKRVEALEAVAKAAEALREAERATMRPTKINFNDPGSFDAYNAERDAISNAGLRAVAALDAALAKLREVRNGT